jgi:hypothetical protein
VKKSLTRQRDSYASLERLNLLRGLMTLRRTARPGARLRCHHPEIELAGFSNNAPDDSDVRAEGEQAGLALEEARRLENPSRSEASFQRSGNIQPGPSMPSIDCAARPASRTSSMSSSGSWK